jgi:hypothetical protein
MITGLKRGMPVNPADGRGALDVLTARYCSNGDYSPPPPAPKGYPDNIRIRTAQFRLKYFL